MSIQRQLSVVHIYGNFKYLENSQELKKKNTK